MRSSAASSLEFLDMFTSAARQKFRFQVTPSDRQLWAIGMVAVQWGAIEQFVKVFVHGLTNPDDAKDPARKLFDSTRPMHMRLSQWTTLTTERMNAPWRERLLPLINETRQVQDLRDKIMHGAWDDNERSGPFDPRDAHGVFSWGQPRSPFSWKLTYGDILKVALRMEQLQVNLIAFCVDAGDKSLGQNPNCGDALRRISNIPSLP